MKKRRFYLFTVNKISSLYRKEENETLDRILHAKTPKQVSSSLWESFMGKQCPTSCKNLKILILNAPCNGFGDLVFAIKLAGYLRKWYQASVTIATTFEKGLLGLGTDPKEVVGLVGGSETQCIKFNGLSFNKNIPEQDLILVAPVTVDFDGDLNDVKKLIPYSNMFNTYFFSEYNDITTKNFTFNTGIGNNRDGLLLTDTSDIPKGKPKGIKNPFVVVYVADSLDGLEKCILAFVEMVAKKYHNKKEYKNLDIVIPPWFFQINIDKQLQKKVSKYYPNIIIKNNNSDIYVHQGSKSSNTLTFRCDILPVPNNTMLQLMRESIQDILLTGDQSITDALSCCPDKNIFYQIAPWKTLFAKNLAKLMPNIYLKRVSTSCGTINAIYHKSNYKKFIQDWDFRKKARTKMDAVVMSSLAIKEDDGIALVADLVDNSKNIESLKKKIKILDRSINYSTIKYKTPIKKSNIKKGSRNRSPRNRSPRNRSPRNRSPRKRSPRKRSPRKRSPRNRSPRKRSPKKRSPRKRSPRKRSPRNRSVSKCQHGVKKDGDCKKKPGPKKRSPRNRLTSKCQHGVKKDGDCKKKPGPKK